MTSTVFQKAENKSHSIAGSLFKKNENVSLKKNHVPFEVKHAPAFNFGNININDPRNNLGIQPKLQINQPGDQYEQEADAMADKVMRMSDNDVAQNSYKTSTATIQRKCAECEKEDEEKKVQRKESNNSSPVTAPPVVHNVLNSPGKAMDGNTRSFMESRFGYDFGDVRIHDNNLAAKSASSINALAYTFGNNIGFNTGYYNPHSVSGKRLLAHELTHVIQQRESKIIWINRKEGDESDDANISLGIIDDSLIGKGAEEIIGHTEWIVLKEFLRGMAGGIKSMPEEQRQRIEAKFNKQGFVDTAKYTAGYSLGIIEGIGSSIYGLFEAIVTLLKLPYEIEKFLFDTLFNTLPDLAIRYGPRIKAFLLKNGGIEQRMQKVITDFLQNPLKNLAEIQAMLDAIGNLALSKVRELGHGVAAKTLAFLEEPWFEYGRDIGKVVGQILFEVILAVASDAIGNIVKEALAVTGRLVTRAATGIVEILRTVGRVIGEALEWISKLGSKVNGKMGEMCENARALLSELRTLIVELTEESALAETGAGSVRVPSPKLDVLESRAVKPPAGNSRAVSDLKPPDVHPSNLPKEPISPRHTLPSNKPNELATARGRSDLELGNRTDLSVENLRSLQNERPVADAFAKAGYDVEFTEGRISDAERKAEGLRTTANPDLRVNGNLVDIYSPSRNSNPIDAVEHVFDKVRHPSGPQTRRVAVALDDSSISRTQFQNALKKYIEKYGHFGMQEIFAVQKGKVYRMYP
jgi:hypothetical protein